MIMSSFGRYGPELLTIMNSVPASPGKLHKIFAHAP